MPRSTGGATHSRKRKRVLKAASGFRAASGTLYRPAIEFVRKAGVYAYRDRRQRKRHFRSLWITPPRRGPASPRDQLQPVHSGARRGRH